MKKFSTVLFLACCWSSLVLGEERFGVIDEIGAVQGESIVIDGKRYKLPEKMIVSVSGHDSIPVSYLKMGFNVLYTLGSDTKNSQQINRMEVIGPAENVRKYFLINEGLGAD